VSTKAEPDSRLGLLAFWTREGARDLKTSAQAGMRRGRAAPTDQNRRTRMKMIRISVPTPIPERMVVSQSCVYVVSGIAKQPSYRFSWRLDVGLGRDLSAPRTG
jgi:hypothetical protein